MHDVVLRSVERFRLPRVRKESIAAERELRHMALDRLALALTLAFAELDATRQALSRTLSVNDVRGDRCVRRGSMREVGDGAMIGVQIKARRTDNQRRLDLLDNGAELIAQLRVSSSRQGGDALIGKGEERRRVLANAQTGERAERLAAAHRPPLRSIAGLEKKFSFRETLRPGIVFAIGHEDDVNVTACRENSLDQTTSRDDVVVRMRRQNDGTLNGKRESH